MTEPNRRTISIAEDRRARIPFAMIGVLVLITSTTAVTVLNSQDENKKESPNVGLAVDRTEAAAQAATRESVSKALQSAAKAPVTSPNDSSAVGEALEPEDTSLSEGSNDYKDAVFRRYVKLQIYLTARERVARADQRMQDGARTNASLPAITNDKNSVEDAIDRVEMDVGMYDSDVPDGQVQVELSDVNITVTSKNGTRLAQQTTTLNASVPSTVFQLHEKNQEYNTRLSTGFVEGFDEGIGYGFGQKYAIRQYPVSWAKAYFDRLTGPPNWADAFDPTISKRHAEILANDAIYDVQRSTFGTADPYEDRIMRERWACFGLSTLWKVYNAKAQASGVGGSGLPTYANGTVNTTALFYETFNYTLMDKLNETARNRMIAAAGGPGGTINEQKLCDATRALLGDSTGDFEKAPSITTLLPKLIQNQVSNNTDPEDGQNITVKVDSFADAAYYEMRGWDVMAEIAGDLESSTTDGQRNVSNLDESGSPGDYDGAHETDEFDEPDEGADASDFNNKIGEIINDTYSVNSYTSVSTDDDSRPTADSKGGDWDETGDDYDVTSSSLTVKNISKGNDQGDQSKTTRLQVFTVSVDNTLKHTRDWEKTKNGSVVDTDETTETGDVNYEVNITLFAQHSTGSNFTTRGLGHAYGGGDGPGPGGVPNYNDVRDQATRSVFSHGISGIKQELENRVNAGTVETLSDLENQMSYSESVSVDASLSDSEYQSLHSWIKNDINQTRTELIDEVESTNVTRQELVSNDDTLEPIRDEVTDPQRIDSTIIDPNTQTNGRYPNPKARARAEAQRYYIDAVVDWTENVRDERQDATDSANSKIQDGIDNVDANINEALGFAQDALSGDVSTSTGTLRGTPQDRDAELRISASPSYLSRESLGRDKIPAARASDEGPADTNSTATHGPMAIKYDNIFLPDPGFPLIPWPGYWYGTLSSWRLQVDGEYARFETTATTTDGSTSTPTTYARSDRPVDVDLDGETVTAGRVEPIGFESETLLVIITPSYQVLARGEPGVGDSGGANQGKWYDCSATFPDVGPNAADNADCNYILD